MAELTFDSTAPPCAGLTGGDGDKGPSPGGGGHGRARGHGHGHAGGELVLSFLGEMCAADPAFASLLLRLVDDSKRPLGGKNKDGGSSSSGGRGRGRGWGWGTAGVDAGDDGAAAAARDKRLLAVRRNTRMRCSFLARCGRQARSFGSG